MSESLESRLMLTDVTVGAGETYGSAGAFENDSLDSYTQQAGSTLQVEIGSTGFDQISVTNQATLDGELQVVLAEGFVPNDGDTFDFLTFDSLSGAFASGTGLFGFGDGDLYFDLVEQADRLQLVARHSPLLDAVSVEPDSEASADAFGQFFNADYFGFERLTASGSLTVNDFFSVDGDFVLTGQSVDVSLADGASVSSNAWQIGGTGLCGVAGAVSARLEQ